MAQMATALRARTDFYMLNPTNGYDILSVCPSSSLVNQGASADVETIRAAMRTSPCGTTPLTESVARITAMIEPHARDLQARGERVAVIIATDGLPNDCNSFVSAMQALQRLPVWLQHTQPARNPRTRGRLRSSFHKTFIRLSQAARGCTK